MATKLDILGIVHKILVQIRCECNLEKEYHVHVVTLSDHSENFTITVV